MTCKVEPYRPETVSGPNRLGAGEAAGGGDVLEATGGKRAFCLAFCTANVIIPATPVRNPAPPPGSRLW